MNLFQTSPIVTTILDYKYQTKLKEQQGTIDTDIAESRNQTSITTTGMQNESAEKQTTQTNLFRLGEKVIDRVPEIVGIGIGGYTLGKSSKNNHNKGNGNKPSSQGSSSDATSELYQQKLKEFDELFGNTKINSLADMAKGINNITNKLNNVQLVPESKFSVSNLLPIVTTGLGAIGMSLNPLITL